MIRLIVSDIDGTLVPESSTKINSEYMEVIRALHAKGVQFALSSGRQDTSMDIVFHPVRSLVYYLSDNGACIRKNGELLSKLCMSPAKLRALLEDIFMIPDCCTVVSTKDQCYTSSKDPDFLHLIFEEYKLKGDTVTDITPYINDCVKISLYSETGSRRLYDLLQKRWKDVFGITISGANWLDINDLNVSKGNALLWLQNTLSISPEETVTFGDNFNDVSMFQHSEMSYASVLAHPDVRKAARYSVPSYEEDGVLQVLKQILAELDSK